MAGRLFDAIFKHPTSAHVKKLAEGNLEFALNLYEAISQQNEGGNVFFSPFSITVALGMTNAGARKKSSEEVRKIAKFDVFENDDALNSAFNTVLQSLTSEGEDGNQQYTLNVANGMYIQESYDVLEDVLDILRTQFLSQTHKADFAKDSHNVTKQINEWVAVATKEKIKNLIPHGVINNLTRLVLVNAIYFKGNWKDKFNPRVTSPGEFHINVNDVIQAEFMRSNRNYAFVHNDQLKCKMIEIPYAGDRLVMQVILPDDIDGLTPLVKQLSPDIFQVLRTSMHPTPEVALTFPKFKLDIGLELNKIMHDLGIQELFIPEKADLTGFSPKGDLHVSNVIHKAFLEVNESGTEAAAATAVANRYRRAAVMQVCRETDVGKGNLIFSPFSITAALAMTWAGARNETAKQIRDILEIEVLGNDHLIHQAFYDLLQHLQNRNNVSSTSNKSVLHSANRFYIDQCYDILEDFSNVLSKKYLSELGRLNFAQNLNQARADINEWVEEVTNNKVRNLIQENVLTASTRIVLVNAIYFKGTWNTRFEPDKIHRGNFYRRKFEKPSMVTMMENRAVFPFVIDYDFKCKVVELPYTGSHLRMLIFLPFDVEGLPHFERKFNPALIKFLKKSMAKTKLTVVIPQLKMNSSIPLGDTLMAMGVRDLFYHDKADLSGITGTRELHYFDLIHNTFLDANEGGRIVQGSTKTVPSRHRSQELSFIADHPFIFLIYDKPSKMTFFIGRFSDPSAIALPDLNLASPEDSK